MSKIIINAKQQITSHGFVVKRLIYVCERDYRLSQQKSPVNLVCNEQYISSTFCPWRWCVHCLPCNKGYARCIFQSARIAKCFVQLDNSTVSVHAAAFSIQQTTKAARQLSERGGV
jgi:hypothetical protein